MYNPLTRLFVFLTLAFSTLSMYPTAEGADVPKLPNILWLTFEDTSEYELACYGNPTTKTPNIDGLAKDGVKFTQARAVAPYCSPSRSTLMCGTHATVFGTDWHRHNVNIPQKIFYWVPLLRERGYYCTNNVKTDYNASQATPIWDESSATATYNNPDRKSGQPFFAVFNNMCTHMSRLTTVTLDKRVPCRIDASKVVLPDHVPDLPEIRADYALHLEGTEDVDSWVGVFLEDLKKRKLDDDTIIFVFSDHGGCLPRGKAFPYETGFRMPLVVYVPPKWRHLCKNLPMGKESDRLIGFEDMGPTVLSLAGLKSAAPMNGVAFLGDFAQPPKKYQHCFRSNTGGHYDPVHTVTDGRFKYGRCFTPYKAFGLRQEFQWNMPSQLAWDDASLKRTIEEKYRAYYLPKTTEMLFDIENDPWEMNDLSKDPKYSATLQELRAETLSWMKANKDLSLIPAPFRWEMSEEPLYDVVRKTDYPLNDLIDLAWAASEGDKKSIERLTAALQDPRPEFRFWAASGFATLAYYGRLSNIVPELTEVMNSDHPTNAAVAMEAVFRFKPNSAVIQKLLNNSDGVSNMMNLLSDNAEKPEIRVPILEASKSMNARRTNTYSFRSFLISIGELPMSSLYTDKDIESGYASYRQQLNWKKHLPNPLDSKNKSVNDP